MWNLIVLAFATTAAIGDAAWRKIPAGFATAGVVTGLVYSAFHGFLGTAFAACVLGFAVGLALFHLGAIGGGDVKLLMALGALLGFQKWALAMEVAVVVAAVIAIVQVIRRNAGRAVLRNMREIASGLWGMRFQEHPVVNVRNAAMVRAPFGVAAAIGTWAALLVK